MIEFRCEKSKFIDQTAGMVGNRYQNVLKAHQTSNMVGGNMKKISKSNLKIFPSIESLQYYILYLENFNTWNIFQYLELFQYFTLVHGFTAKLSIESFCQFWKILRIFFLALRFAPRNGLALVLSGGGARPRLARFARFNAAAREFPLSHRLALALWAFYNILFIILLIK